MCPAPLVPKGRRKLAAVVQATSDVITIDDVVAILFIERPEAIKLLSRWTGQAWLRRVGPGAYVPAPLDLLESKQVLKDPWVLIPTLYAPAYIGGWTAAEHWDLTEQMFRPILVMTTRTVRKKHQTRHGTQFMLNHIQNKKLFGIEPLWRSQSKVFVSDIHRTVVDMLDRPAIGGGIRHVEECLATYLKCPGRDDGKLIDYTKKMGNGAIFKRLGYLTEKHPGAKKLSETCLLHLTKGNAKIDPALECSRLASKWHLRIPQGWTPGHAHD